jgi:RND family efflux transporter MFP subunit
MEFVGRIEAETVAIRPRVSGYITKIAVEHGATVKTGDIIAEIDPRPYQAKLDLAHALLQQAEAKLQFATATLRRAKTARDAGAASQEQLDEAQAEVEVATAAIRVAKAGKDHAALDLSFTKLTSPIDGRVGRIGMTTGNLVIADQETPITIVVATDRLTVVFEMDEASLLQLRRAGLKEKLAVGFGLSDEKGYPRKAEVTLFDSEVDPKTGTIRVHARCANPDGVMSPGMFVRVRLDVAGKK